MNDCKQLALDVNATLREQGLMLATAESCTGGSIAAYITSCAGSSDVFKGAVVAYSNEAKSSILGVSPRTIALYGAVSEQVVREMVLGAQRVLHCDCAVATSGIAGPSGGTADKPVGTVWIAVAVGENVKTELLQLEDKGRSENICASVKKVLSLLLNTVREN